MYNNVFGTTRTPFTSEFCTTLPTANASLPVRSLFTLPPLGNQVLCNCATHASFSADAVKAFDTTSVPHKRNRVFINSASCFLKHFYLFWNKQFAFYLLRGWDLIKKKNEYFGLVFDIWWFACIWKSVLRWMYAVYSCFLRTTSRVREPSLNSCYLRERQISLSVSLPYCDSFPRHP